MNILVSACLLGVGCRYSGTGCVSDQVLNLRKRHNLIPVCPEQLGGLATPRDPVELVGNKAVTRDGTDYTAQFEKGADETVKLAEIFQCSCAVLKSRSPSCGCGLIYDGTFSGKLISGNGVTAERLLKKGISVFTENDCEKIPKKIM